MFYVAHELELIVNKFALCLGHKWCQDVIGVDFGLGKCPLIEISDVIAMMSVNEVIALMLAFGQQRFATGPVKIVAEMTTECK